MSLRNSSDEPMELAAVCWEGYACNICEALCRSVNSRLTPVPTLGVPVPAPSSPALASVHPLCATLERRAAEL